MPPHHTGFVEQPAKMDYVGMGSDCTGPYLSIERGDEDSTMKLYSRIVAVLLTLTLVLPAWAAPRSRAVDVEHKSVHAWKTAKNEAAFIEYTQGTYPLIIVAGHGGSDSPDNWVVRNGPEAMVEKDVYTAPISRGVVSTMQTRYGRRPYLIVNRIHRKYVDVNRPAGAKAFESAEGKSVYTSYHKAIARAVREAVQRWGFAFLVDVHGQTSEPADLYLGTARRRAMNDLSARWGENAISGPDSLENHLWNWGYSIPRDIPPPGPYEVPSSVSGGHVVKIYGQPQNIDAIQIEIHRRLRMDASSRDRVISDLADALHYFCETYVDPMLKP